MAAGRVAQAIVRLYLEQLAINSELLHSQQITWYAEQAERFEDYMRRERDPKFEASLGWPQR